MPQELKIALFGNGFARSTILPCLRRVEGARVAGIASPNLDRARETAAEFGIEHAAADYREILRDAAPDLVFVVSPPHRHLEMAVDALRAGCHVVCEKPTALSRGESASMLEEATKHRDRVALLDHELRFDPRRKLLVDLVRAGEIGEVLRADYLLHSSGRRKPEAPWSWWSDRLQGGGAWGAIGSHAVDALRLLAGEVDEARGSLFTWTKERPDPATGRPRLVTTDDFAEAALRFRSGALGTISISMVEEDRRHEILVTGASGSLRLREQRPLERFRSGAWEEVPIVDDLPPSAALGIPDTDWARAFLRMARRLVHALSRGEASLEGAATFLDGHRNQVVLDAVRESDERGAWVGATA